MLPFFGAPCAALCIAIVCLREAVLLPRDAQHLTFPALSVELAT